ncbi:MAG: cysteine hydrolase [Nitrospinae bacterium]|nr:cysteine hydrolase [Nitrospinota bacterium]
MPREVIIVVDMLKGFLEKGNPLFCGDDSRRIIPEVVSLLKGHKSEEIIYLCDSHVKDDKEFNIFPPHCIKGSKEGEIIDELKPFKGKIIPKTRYSGFFNTSIEDELKRLKPYKVIVVGLCTDICVMYTVADLRNRDYEVDVPQRCVASFDKDAHNFALQHMEKILGAKVV